MREQRVRRNQVRRRREVRHQILFLIATAVMILVLAVTAGSFLSKANDSESNNPSYKYFSSVQITPGASLYSIAEENMSGHYTSVEDYMEEVMHINALEEETIHAGQYLIVPYYSEAFK